MGTRAVAQKPGVNQTDVRNNPNDIIGISIFIEVLAVGHGSCPHEPVYTAVEARYNKYLQ